MAVRAQVGGWALWVTLLWLLAVVIRYMDSMLCGPHTVFLFGHAWWHVLGGYCGHVLLAVLSYARADNYLCVPELSCMWGIVPKVTWRRPPVFDWLKEE